MFEPPKDYHNAEIEAALSAALVSKRSEEKPRSYLGASRWGHHCERALGYEYHRTPKDAGSGFKADTYRIFDMGHDVERRAAEYLIMAGYDLQTHGKNGKQLGFMVANDRLGGHCDGVIHSGPGITKAPLIWECKGLNDKSWNDTKAKGVKVSKPVYYAQMQTYIAYMTLEGYMFTAINRNTGEVFIELGEPDMRTAQEVSDRAGRVVEAESPEDLPRCAAEETDWRCKFCDYKRTCWNKDKAVPSVPGFGISFNINNKQRTR
jgi:hypothetical protein